MRIHLHLNVPTLYHTIFKMQGRIVKFLPRREKTVKMSQKPEKPTKKRAFPEVRVLKLKRGKTGKTGVHKPFTQIVKESQKYLLTIGNDVLYYNQTKG